VAEALEAMQQDSAAGTGTKLPALRVDGGAAVNDLMMQFQADVLGVPVLRPRVTETTALGAAYLAGLAVGFWGGESELRAQRQSDARFEPAMAAAEVAARRGRWKEAVERSRRWNG
jgi:glycerol kinase